MTNDKPPVAPFAMTSGEYVIMPKPKADALEDLIAKADAACDYADAHCRAFPIATAPRGQVIHIWDTVMNGWDLNILGEHSEMDSDWTHWRPLPPPPSNPPLPAVFVELGAALERLKAQNG